MSTQEKTQSPDASVEDGGAEWRPLSLHLVRSRVRSSM